MKWGYGKLATALLEHPAGIYGAGRQVVTECYRRVKKVLTATLVV
jgi:hypothetical protein